MTILNKPLGVNDNDLLFTFFSNILITVSIIP